MDATTLKRAYNIDLLRIIATMFVIILHVLGQGGILKNTSPDSITYYFAWFLEISALCAVNCFALISGFIMVNKSIRIKNVMNLWFQVVFYSLLLTFIFFVAVPETRSIKGLIYAFFLFLQSNGGTHPHISLYSFSFLF